jgi:hypothetical protein
MKLTKALTYYLRSNTSITLSGLLLGIIAAAVLFKLPVWVPVVSGFMYLAAGTAIFFSRRGAEEIVNEKEVDRAEQNQRKIAAASALLEKLTALRIPEGAVRDRLNFFIVHAGRSLTHQRRRNIFLPKTAAAVEDTLKAVGSYLNELDRISLEKRYGTDQDGGSGEEIEHRAAAYIQRQAEFIKDERLSQLPQETDLDFFEAREDMDSL